MTRHVRYEWLALQPGEQPATASLLDTTQLPADARLIAIKAEQHYVRIWSDQGTDFIRHRFSDLVDTLKHHEGVQTHRSWWVNLNCVQERQQSGRKLELVVNDDLSVPVSASFKNTVLEQLGDRLD